ncbi:MAG: L-ribulose-5-phosphate 4-epimerase [uncultured bacterium]|uniref:L-ribulose-5-phosphate 4-epimerase n=1 Tax=candidate division WWE3 bacterium RBG_16_37_10 TaxID=1802610 RepID=A0A1F4V1U9_UNCKA|nr:MAG: L-ribulose-5-phosphate 4-epimerase [uncultured bacterium]OGC51050.1 MAG: L-ribulose-5-phosphate 4-epimerase [candidate division WWE3 bacterium RBG_16_37_10]
MLESLKKQVLKANKDLPKHDLVKLTWGNVSAISDDRKFVIIKPSGIEFETTTPKDMVVLDLKGRIVEGKLKPSVDTPTHLVLYKRYKNINSIVHTHSTYATIFAQANQNIPCLGTTHADHFCGDIPLTRKLTKREIQNDYEYNTGLVIIETLKNASILKIPAILVANHGVFSWGRNTKDAIHNSVAVEEVAKMALFTLLLNKNSFIDSGILNKHFSRKNSKSAYYGQ